MPRSITIRNVPDDVCDALAARAARSGRSLQKYLLTELAGLAGRPSMEDWLERLRAHKAATGTRLPSDEILDYRDRHRR
ncbi:MAG: hypothetical protein M3493_09920 [Actinomycetota bacterium]|jgi:hypothetical protein|nr:hypothetical protein [Actinomycetota bacterium]